MKTYFVSGAGSGIGRSIVQTLDQNKDQPTFALFGRNLENLRETQNSLRNPDQHPIVIADQCDEGGMNSSFETLLNKVGSASGVIANAGIALPNQGVDENWQKVIDTNLTGTYRFIEKALPALRASTDEYRHIIIISSTLSKSGLPMHSAYSASKAGLLALTRTLAVELAPEKILVNAICPGWVDTNMGKVALEWFMEYLKLSDLEARENILRAHPLRKISQPEEVAQLVSFLLSNKQISITGQTLFINNGFIMP